MIQCYGFSGRKREEDGAGGGGSGRGGGGGRMKYTNEIIVIKNIQMKSLAKK